MGKKQQLENKQRHTARYRSLEEGGVGVRSPSAHVCHRKVNRAPHPAYKREGEATARTDREGMILYKQALSSHFTTSGHSSDSSIILTSIQFLNGWEETIFQPSGTCVSIGTSTVIPIVQKVARTSLSRLTDQGRDNHSRSNIVYVWTGPYLTICRRRRVFKAAVRAGKHGPRR